jgi:acetyltransferase-like isoleucine patch superfamily enzyme
MARSLQSLLPLQRVISRLHKLLLRRFWGMDIAESAKISLRARLDITYPRGVHVGEWSWVAFDAVVLTHDRTRGIFTDTIVGKNCFIGARSILMPGITVGDGCVVGAGAVVTRDVPPNCAVGGNPARVLRDDLRVGKYGRYPDADEVTNRLMAEGKYVS